MGSTIAPSDLDWELIQECIAGNSQAWRTFVDRFARWSLHLIHELLRRARAQYTPQDAEDLLQDVLAYLVREDCRELRALPRGVPPAARSPASGR